MPWSFFLLARARRESFPVTLYCEELETGPHPLFPVRCCHVPRCRSAPCPLLSWPSALLLVCGVCLHLCDGRPGRNTIAILHCLSTLSPYLRDCRHCTQHVANAAAREWSRAPQTRTPFSRCSTSSLVALLLAVFLLWLCPARRGRVPRAPDRVSASHRAAHSPVGPAAHPGRGRLLRGGAAGGGHSSSGAALRGWRWTQPCPVRGGVGTGTRTGARSGSRVRSTGRQHGDARL